MEDKAQTLGALTIELAELSKERDRLVSKLKEYDSLEIEKQGSLHQYVENSDDMVYQLSITLDKFLYVNLATEQACGCPRADLLKSSHQWFELIHPDDRQLVHQSMIDMIKTNKRKMLLEYRLKSPEGVVSYVSDRLVLVSNKDGSPYSLIGIAIDMTTFINIRKNLFTYDQALNVVKRERSTEVIIDKILKILCNSFDWDEGEIWVLNRATDFLYCVKIWHKLTDDISEFYKESFKLKIPANSGFQGLVIHNNAPTLVTDFPLHSEFYRSNVSSKLKLNTALGIPIVYQNTLIGVLVLFDQLQKNPDVGQIDTIQGISEIVAGVIQRGVTEEKLEHITTHNQLTGLLNRAGLESSIKKIIH